jgi:hypothetical protein
MTSTNEQTKKDDPNADEIGEKKKLKWKSFVEEDLRAALTELIQTAPSVLLKNIEAAILYKIPEEVIPANFIGVPSELYLIYFLVLDPQFFQVERFAVRNVTIDDVKYNKDEIIPLNVNDRSDCLMLAKVGFTHVNLAIIIDDKTEDVEVSIKYGDNEPYKIPFDSSKSSGAFIYDIAKAAAKNLILRPDNIMTDMSRYLCNGNSNFSEQPYQLHYFIVETTNHHYYKSRAFEVEKHLRSGLSFFRAHIEKEVINERLCQTAPKSLAATIGPSEWIVTSRSIGKCLEPSLVQQKLYSPSTRLPLNDSVRDLRTKFQSDYHDQGRFRLELRYNAWIYSSKPKRITRKTGYEKSDLRVVEITFDQN